MAITAARIQELFLQARADHCADQGITMAEWEEQDQAAREAWERDDFSAFMELDA